MAFRQRQACYSCNVRFNPQQLKLMTGDENIIKREIALTRRETFRHPPLPINDNSRLCLNCNQSISNEIRSIQEDPTCLRLNVLTQSTSSSCCICNARENVYRLSVECRVYIFIQRNIYVPDNVRCCEHHLDENGLLHSILLPGLRFINRPYVIKGNILQIFLQQLRNEVVNKLRVINENEFTDDEFKCISPITKQNFNDLFTYCDPVIQHGKQTYIAKKDLLTFLCKMKQGLSDDFLKVIFNYSSRQNVSLVIDKVRLSLLKRFVPENIGFRSIDRNNFIEQHVSEFANVLYNAQPEEPKAIIIADATYSYIQKSSNFRVLRQSYSMHKNRHLLKPTLLVAPDGYILAIFGPYFSDARNNDANILKNEFERDADSIRQWFQNGDIVLVDRGYRDVIPFLQRLGIQHKMPALLQRGQRQLSIEDANQSRIVTKNRWIVEARNGHIRLVFKFFNNVISVVHAKNLNSFYNIAGAILNRYHPVINMEGATAELARNILRKSRSPNEVQARVEVDNLRLRNGQWRHLSHHLIPDFPVLTMDYLNAVTIGVYQVNLAPSYIQDKIDRDTDEELQVDEHINEPGFLRVRVYSRFRNATKHQIFIQYKTENEDGNRADEDILGYYCTCQSGARTLGTCVHVASILWFLGYARHQPNIKYPDKSLINIIKYATNQRGNEDIAEEGIDQDGEIEVIED